MQKGVSGGIFHKHLWVDLSNALPVTFIQVYIASHMVKIYYKMGVRKFDT